MRPITVTKNESVSEVVYNSVIRLSGQVVSETMHKICDLSLCGTLRGLSETLLLHVRNTCNSTDKVLSPHMQKQHHK